MKTLRPSFLKFIFLIGIICYDQSVPLAWGQETYIVAKGDTVALICRRFQLATEQLLTANPDLNPSRLTVGQQINIPSKSKNGTAANNAAPSWPGVKSPIFKAAFDYGVAQTMYSTFEFNNWSSLSNSKLSQGAQQKLGKPVRTDVFISKNSNDDSFRASVFFPDFSIGNQKLVLVFDYDGKTFSFVENRFGEELSNFDLSETNVNLILPENYHSLVETDFQPKAGDITRVQDCCREMLKSDYPVKANGTNHFFIAPYSKKYDRRPISLYWVEGKKVIEITHLSYPDGSDGFLPKEMSDFSAPIQAENAGDFADSSEWREFGVSRHVVDGMMITVEPSK